MSDAPEQVVQAWFQLSGWELAAVILAVAYLVLAVRQNPLCWYCGFASTGIYTLLYWDVDLLMQSGLNVYYMGMAVFGWWQWRHGGRGDTELAVQTWPWYGHLGVLSAVLLISLLTGSLLTEFTRAAWPYLDSFATWAAVVTTYMVARKILENWIYWMVINSLSLFLLIDREMYLTGLLMLCYLAISVVGWMSWYRDYRHQDYRRQGGGDRRGQTPGSSAEQTGA